MPTPDRDRVDKSVTTARERPQSATSQTVAELCSALDSTDSRLRQSAAIGVATVAETSPDLLLDDLEELLPWLDDEQAAVRNSLTAAVASVIQADPDAGEVAIPTLLNRLDDPFETTRAHALDGLLPLVSRFPVRFESAVPSLVDLLRDPADDPTVPQRAVALLLELADQRPSDVAVALQALLDILDDWHAPAHLPARDSESNVGTRSDLDREFEDATANHTALREGASAVVARIATGRPARVTSVVGDIADRLDDPNPTVRKQLLEALDRVAVSHPAALEDALSAVADRLRDDDEAVVGSATLVLALAAESAPTSVAKHAGTDAEHVCRLLSADDSRLRTAATCLLAYVAEVDPQVVAPFTDDLVARLDDDDAAVRGQAVWALTHLGADEAGDRLADLARNDPEPGVRHLASESLNLLNE